MVMNRHWLVGLKIERWTLPGGWSHKQMCEGVGVSLSVGIMVNA